MSKTNFRQIFFYGFKLGRSVAETARDINEVWVEVMANKRFMFRRLGHAYEVYPLLFLAGFWVVISCVTIYYSFTKIEVWLDRSKSYSPLDWERARDNYWRKGTVAFDFEGRARQRCELMEILQDEMLEAAKKRGMR
ncbi:unnamed protein product [Angiostrongylus costaricensis]|uniref:HTH_48 domain-containing protein n=1 Tax=Angiostrongylus costaricensis TaxID=334426 RepID=A0A0R3PIY9_ANGCS|nr:unnamed protein product [Angiostrongylus costaricensis]